MYIFENLHIMSNKFNITTTDEVEPVIKYRTSSTVDNLPMLRVKM